jgi:protein-arginine kinase activator protein McsA
MKQCSKCNTVRDYFEFYKDSQSKDGYAYSCKPCRKEYEIQYSKTDKYKEKIRRIRWKEAGIDITFEQYQEMLKEQNSCCAVCGTNVNQFNKGMCVDHNHTTGKVRGLLCTDCNRGIGSLKDNKELLQKALDYLNKYE